MSSAVFGEKLALTENAAGYTGQVNVTCPVGSTLSCSAEFKLRI
jgi:hypothetical protein